MHLRHITKFRVRYLVTIHRAAQKRHTSDGQKRKNEQGNHHLDQRKTALRHAAIAAIEICAYHDFCFYIYIVPDSKERLQRAKFQLI